MGWLYDKLNILEPNLERYKNISKRFAESTKDYLGIDNNGYGPIFVYERNNDNEIVIYS